MDFENNTPREETTAAGGLLKYIDIVSEMKKAGIDYSMSVITSRALPDVRDGLKPVHRRILYTMYENGLSPDKAYRKCADTVGSVLGRYHPHGDASVYDAMVRLAQNFSMRYPLVDGHGNFGSIDGDPPAAYRYTESRMGKLTLEMLTDIDKETVDFMPNYDDRLKEPTVLPSKFPNILVNGSTGIAVGMATNIPPHNMGEVLDGIFCVMDNPDATLEDLMEHVKGPDFPTGGTIMGRAGIRAAYGTGRGKITLRSKCEIVEKKNGRFQIKVTEIPYQIRKMKLIEDIADLVKEKRIEGISDINDYSDRKGMNICIDLKREANPQLVLNQLYSYSQLQISYGIILLALVNGEPKILTLRQIIDHYIDHQCDVIIRRTQFYLRKAEERVHILRALLKAIDNIDGIIELIKASESIPAAKEALMERFGFDEIQATHIVQMRLGQLTGLEREKLENELNDLLAKIDEYHEILGSHEKVLGVIRGELEEIRRKYGDERRTEIVNISGEVDDESLIPMEECVYTLTSLGYIKRQPLENYRQQRRGGKGVKGMTQREEDATDIMFSASSHARLMFFTTRGKAYTLKGYEIPEGSRQSKGMNIVNILPIESGEKVSAIITLPDEVRDEYVCMVTRNGVIKRTRLDSFAHIRKNGIIALSLDEDDSLAWVHLTGGNDNILVGTENGMSITFNEQNARSVGRTARGVRAISLKPGDKVAGFCVLTDDTKVFTVSETGYGRLSENGDYRIQSRGGLGLKNYRTDVYGKVAAVLSVHEDEDIILISSDGIIIRIPAAQISVVHRPSKGVRVMRVAEGERVTNITAVPADEEEETELPPDDETGDETEPDVTEEEEEIIEDGPVDDEPEEDEPEEDEFGDEAPEDDDTEE
ncbi:MAG: DNA gyrase subunit A [Clostridia bacterium]|nr:DNA gyrase subunit A [Clostridia bacterium]